MCTCDIFLTASVAGLLKVWDLAAALEPLPQGAAAEPPAEKKGGKKGSGAAAVEEIEPAAGENAVRELKVTAAVAAHDKDINAVAVSPNDAFICTASQDRTAKVRKLDNLGSSRRPTLNVVSDGSCSRLVVWCLTLRAGK